MPHPYPNKGSVSYIHTLPAEFYAIGNHQAILFSYTHSIAQDTAACLNLVAIGLGILTTCDN